MFAALTLSLASGAPNRNPFEGAEGYQSFFFAEEVQYAIAHAPADLVPALKKVQNVSVAVWLDKIATIPNITKHFSAARDQQKRSGRDVVIQFVVYDLPNRDCAAAASNGELDVKKDGLNRYKTEYIDPIVAEFRKASDIGRIVVILEPDSLPNLATNLNVPKCQEAQDAYKQGVAYALKQLSSLNNVYIYLDIAHGGWLGWDDNRGKAARVYSDVFSAAGGDQVVRGFITNTANYQPLGSPSSTDDPCNLQSQANKAIDESHFVQLIDNTFSSYGIRDKHYLIDTSRNGVTNMRRDCSNWCNIKGAGLGERPKVNPSSQLPIDAYVWVKTPGESDGTSDSSAARYDFHCGSSDSYTPAPEAGAWNNAYFLELVRNARPPF